MFNKLFGRRASGCSSSHSIIINGNNCQSLTVVNGEVTIDGVRQPDMDVPPYLEIRVVGAPLQSLSTTSSVTCNEVQGDVSAGGSVTCDDVGGGVEAGGSVTCDDVSGDVSAGGSVTCDDVGGSVSARGGVNSN